MSKEETSDIKEIKECLIGTEFDRKKGLVYKFDMHCEKTDSRFCIVENQLHTLMQDREKSKNKVTLKKFFASLIGLIVKTKTGM